MLRFFRTLRRKLIEEQRVRQYIYYAFGEIFLVMIGILLALQVNNWNEQRASMIETKNFLEKKLDMLDEDISQLQNLYDYRVELYDDCKRMLTIGIENTGDLEISLLISKVTVERKFSSANTNDQMISSANYFKNIEGTKINEIEKDYFNMIDIVTFSETRLNNFSENLEADLWRSGFFNENREYFRVRDLLTEEEMVSGNLPPLVIPVGQDLRSLEAIIRRNEISSARLSDQYIELMDMNQKLQSEIQVFLSEN